MNHKLAYIDYQYINPFFVLKFFYSPFSGYFSQFGIGEKTHLQVKNFTYLCERIRHDMRNIFRLLFDCCVVFFIPVDCIILVFLVLAVVMPYHKASNHGN